MTEHLIVGLYSPAQQSGKSTVAGFLERNHGFETRHFALALKRMVADLLYSVGYNPEEVGRLMDVDKEAPIPELGGRSFRQLAQTLGTDWGRNLVAKDVWVDILLSNRQRPTLMVIDDVRFPNEFDAIRNEGGVIWRVVRPGVVPTSDHPSEGLLEGFDFDANIVNDGTTAELETKVTKALLTEGL